MAATDEITIAEVYAQALLDLANQKDSAETIEMEFADFAAYLKIDSDFGAFFASQAVDEDDRRESMEKIFRGRMSDLLLNTLQVLNDKGRNDLVALVQQQYHQLFMQQRRIKEVEVTTATPLSDTLRQRLRQTLESRTEQKVTLVELVEPAVLGGLLVRIGDKQIDLSVSKQLERFYKTVVDHASRYIHAGTNLFEGAIDF